MAAYNRLGSFLVADALAPVPTGRIHRALTTAGGAFERHHLLFTFTDELVKAGLAARWTESQRAADQLAGARGVGANYRFAADPVPHVACDFISGRSLAQVLQKTREEQIPLGIDHALTIVQGVAQALVQIHERGLRHGCLSPCSVWVGFEGAVQLLDAPFAPAIQALLPKAPQVQAALAPYHTTATTDPFQQDLFGLGALLYELLTLGRLPGPEAVPAALDQATLRAAQEEEPLPADLLAFLKRLLGVDQPFGSAQEFNGTLDRVLYDGDFSPTTFNMAFLMHTLFREESEREAQAMKEDQGGHFGPAPQPAEARPATAPAGSGKTLPVILVVGGVVMAGLIGGLFFKMRQDNQRNQLEQQSMQAKLAAFQKEKEANDAKLAEIAKQEEAQKSLEEMFGKQAQEGATAEARAAAKKDLEAARQKAKDLARQRSEALKKKQELAQMPAAQPAPAPAPAPVAAAPAPAPAADQPPAVTQKAAAQTPRNAKDALPASLQQSDIRVALKVFVDSSGRPLKVMVVKGVEGSAGYNESAQSAALASVYSPAQKAGKPASGWLNMEYDFGKPK